METENTVYQQTCESEPTRSQFFTMIALGGLGIAGWVIMFSLGLLVDSGVYRHTIVNQFQWSGFFMCVLTYTPTNIALLSIISAFAGGCGSRLIIDKVIKKGAPAIPEPVVDKKDSHFYMTENPFASMLRGLVVYFAFLAGVFVAASDPFANTTADQYAKSAGVVSLIGVRGGI